MSLKQTLTAIAFASAAITGANAQVAPRIIGVTADRAAELCGDAPQKWSLNDGLVGCSEDQSIWEVEIHTITNDTLIVEWETPSRNTGEKPYRELTLKQQQDALLKTFWPTGSRNVGATPPPIRFQGWWAEVTVGILAQEKYGTGFKWQLVFSGDRCWVVLDGHASSKDRDILAGAGCTFDITQDGKIIAILGYATRSTDAAAALGDRTFGGNLTGHQADAHIGYVTPRAKLEFDYQKGQAGDTLLKNVTSSTATPYILDFADRREQWERIDTTRTITTANGQKWTRTSGTVTVSVGPNSEVFVTWGQSNIGHVSSDIWQGWFNTNIGDSALSVSGGQVDRHTAIDARFVTPVGNSGLGLGVFAGTMNGNVRGWVMLSYQLGASWKYQVPRFGGDLTRNTTIGGELAKFGANPMNHVPDLSTVVKITTRVEETQKDVLKKTTPKLNTPLVIGWVTCTATSYTVGGSTTCSITPVDPQGISWVSATIDGTPVTVNNASGTYTAVLSGLAVGTHPLIWSAIGKNPDGTTEAGQTATQTITVSSAAIIPLTPKNETVSTAFNSPAVVNLLANDTTPNTGGVLALVGIPTVTNGTLTVSGSTVTVTPTTGFVGNMVVTYVVSDGKAANITETATITVAAAGNTPPSAINLTPTTLAAGALSVGQSAGSLACTDAESATCTYSLTSQSTAGAFAVSGTGVITIANAGILAGTHSITVVATDAGGLTRSEVKNITINPEVITLPSCTNVIDEQGFPWGTGAPMLFRISNCTPGSTWTVEEVTPSGKQVFDWYGDPRTGSWDAVVGIQIMDGTEGEVPVLKFTVTKWWQNQVYIHTAPYPIF